MTEPFVIDIIGCRSTLWLATGNGETRPIVTSRRPKGRSCRWTERRSNRSSILIGTDRRLRSSLPLAPTPGSTARAAIESP